MNNIPKDMNGIAKMVNDTIKRKQQQPPQLPTFVVLVNGVPTTFVLSTSGSTSVIDHCNACNRPSSVSNTECGCGCHPSEWA